MSGAPKGWKAAPPPAWLLGAHATPSESYYAFGHADDSVSNWSLQWPALGLGLMTFGPIVNVDKEAPPYRNSHLLLTQAVPKSVGSNALSVSYDSFTPLTAAGQPLFAPVWQYMCFS